MVLFRFYNLLYRIIGFKGILFDFFVALSVAVTFLSLIIIIGRIVDRILLFFMRFVVKYFGVDMAIFICNYLTFPGVVFHELAHAFVIFLFGGEIVSIKFFEFTKDGRLGHVSFRTYGSKKQQLCQLSFGSCAPVLLGLGAVFYLTNVILTYDMSLVWRAILIYLLFSILMHMSMSKLDVTNYVRGFSFMVPVTTAIAWFIQYFFIVNSFVDFSKFHLR